jgi:hypothetical protein
MWQTQPSPKKANAPGDASLSTAGSMDSPKQVRDVLSGQFLSLALMSRLQARNTASKKPNRGPKKEDIKTPTGGNRGHMCTHFSPCMRSYVCLFTGWSGQDAGADKVPGYQQIGESVEPKSNPNPNCIQS